MNTYEAMFVFDPAAGSTLESVETEVNRLMTRAEAEVIVTRRLEERRLAFEMDGRKRGLYVLTYFRAEGSKIGPLERDVRLSESILRVLILRADHVTEEVMQNVTLGGMALDKPPSKEPEPSESTGDAAAEPTKDAEPEKASAGSDDSKPELVGTSTESKKESESEA